MKLSRKVIARNPIWKGEGRPTEVERKEFIKEILRINDKVFNALEKR